jgi:hypothetical protein
LIDEYSYKILAEIKNREKARFSDLLRVVKNSRTLSRKLRGLSSMGLVELEDKLYRLSIAGERALGAIESFYEALKPEALFNVDRVPHRLYAPVLKRYCEILFGHFKHRLMGILVFGSVARGDWDKSSDIDLLIVVEGWEKPVWERFRELAELANELRQSDEYKKALSEGYVPIVQEYPLNLEEAKNFNRIYVDACLDGIILHERNHFLSTILDKFRKRLSILGSKRVVLPNGKFYWVLKEVKAGEHFKL